MEQGMLKSVEFAIIRYDVKEVLNDIESVHDILICRVEENSHRFPPPNPRQRGTKSSNDHFSAIN